MIRGTTPLHTFTMPFSLANAAAIYITYSQGQDVVLEKNINNATINDNIVTVQLSQEDTLKFKSNPSKVKAYDKNYNVFVQIRVKMIDDTAFASNIIEVPVVEVLKDGVI